MHTFAFALQRGDLRGIPPREPVRRLGQRRPHTEDVGHPLTPADPTLPRARRRDHLHLYAPGKRVLMLLPQVLLHVLMRRAVLGTFPFSVLLQFHSRVQAPLRLVSSTLL
jgi:hypothetical protein